MKKQILAVMAILMMFSSTIPSYAAVIEAGAGKSATTSQEESTAQEQKSEEATERTTQEETKSQQEINEAAQRKYNADPSINWIVDADKTPTDLKAQYGTDTWWEAEGLEQARKWANDNKGDIENIADEKERYTAIVNKVCDFLSYDTNYVRPHIVYTLRDGKGVCADYTSLTKALCDATNIKAQVSNGIAYGDSHDMLKVALDGYEYYSDPTGVDSGACDVLMSDVPNYYTEQTIHSDLLRATVVTGHSVSQDSDAVKRINAPEGTECFSTADGDFYVTKADADAFGKSIASGDYTVAREICAKYGIPFSL